MKRKLVRQGGGALTVTLPYKWAKQRSFAPGDEIEIEERGQELVIRGHGAPEARRVSADVSTLDDRTIRWLLSGLHKGGYDEIEVAYAGKAQLALVHELVKDLLLGFAVMEQTDRRCVLRMLAKDSSEEFDATLRRAFLVTLSMAESMLDLLRQGKKEELPQLAALERTNNQLTNFCERILNKNLYEGNKGTHFLYVVAWNLEKIADDYRRLCGILAAAKDAKGLLPHIEKANAQLKAYYELLYRFDAGELSALAARRRELTDAIEKAMRSGKEDAVALACLHGILMMCEDFSTSMFMLARG